LTENHQTVQCEVRTDSGLTVEEEVFIVTQNQQTVQCEVLTDSGQNVVDSSGHSLTEPTGGRV
jgi:hypothetical protein